MALPLGSERLDHGLLFISMAAGGRLLNPTRSRSGLFKPGSVRQPRAAVKIDLHNPCTHTGHAARLIEARRARSATITFLFSLR